MDEIIKAEKREELEIQQGNSSIAIVFGKVLKVNSAVNDIDFDGILNKVFQYVNVTEILQNIKKGAEYVVQVPSEFQTGLDNGDFWMMENSKTGKLWPSLMEIGEDGKNHIVTPLPIKKHDFIQGNPLKDLMTNYHNLYMQKQINELANMVESTLDTVKRIEHGQMDDRIGLLNAGKQQIILALSQKDKGSRTNAILLGINNVNVAQNQIAETFKRRDSEFKEIPKTKVDQLLRELAKSGYLKEKDNEYHEIQDYYNLYLESTKMLAASYAVFGDLDNAEKVFELSIECMSEVDFSSLKTIEYAHKGSEFDGIYDYAEEYLNTEKQMCLEDAKQYDFITIDVSGDKLLEVIRNGKTEKISEQKT